MSPDEIVTQFQQIVETLRRVVEAPADVAARVEAEHDNGEKLGLLTGLQSVTPRDFHLGSQRLFSN
jgi:hypothetical protein